MKTLFTALMMLAASSAFATGQYCGGRNGPCPSNAPSWDGHYAPGYPNQGQYRAPTCGGRNGPCPSTAPSYNGCVEGQYSTMTIGTGRLVGRNWEVQTINVVCHNNQWYTVNN